MVKCAHPNCDRRIRSSNTKGVCQSHYKYTGKCKKCCQRCWVQAEYCLRCSHVKKAFEATRLVACQYSGCSRTTTSFYRLCEQHFGNFRECRLTGCGELVKYNSKWGYCDAHRYLTRYHQEDGLEPLSSPEPLPIKRRRLLAGKVYEKPS
jgi:hypothetical protein